MGMLFADIVFGPSAPAVNLLTDLYDPSPSPLVRMLTLLSK